MLNEINLISFLNFILCKIWNKAYLKNSNLSNFVKFPNPFRKLKNVQLQQIQDLCNNWTFFQNWWNKLKTNY